MMIDTQKIDDWIDSYNKHERYIGDDNAITKLFGEYKKNISFETVLAKVCTLNCLYSAGVRNEHIRLLSEYISGIKELDSHLESGSLEAFYAIADPKVDINKVPVFASKYCHFHNPSKYPIFDSYSRIALIEINKDTPFTDAFGYKDLLEYRRFKEILDLFLDTLLQQSKTYNYKDIDKYLWLYGKSIKDDENIGA